MEKIWFIKLYGSIDLSWSEWIETVKQLSAENDQELTHYSAYGEGAMPMKSARRLNLKAAQAVLFGRDRSVLELYSVAEPFLQISLDWTFYAMRDQINMTVFIGTTPTPTHHELDTFQLLVDHIDFLEFGFIDWEHQCCGPAFQSAGIDVDCDEVQPRTNSERITHWLLRDRRGSLPDVFLHNLLTEEHLKQDVNGRSLEHWIGGDRRHGDLREHPRGFWTWEIPEPELARVRKLLIDSGVLR